MKGAGSIGFVLDDKASFTAGEISRLLKDICLSSAEINFCCCGASMRIFKSIDQENDTRGGALSSLHGSIEYDPFGELLPPVILPQVKRDHLRWLPG
jgi:hypothetical protein